MSMIVSGDAASVCAVLWRSNGRCVRVVTGDRLLRPLRDVVRLVSA